MVQSHSKLAIVFPGQGSQSVGMLQTLAQQHAEVQQTFMEASDVLHEDLWQLVQQGPAEKLDQTQYTQPALLTASYAIWRIITKDHPLQPAFMAGHSLGEYSALVCANALLFSDAVKLVSARGAYMQAAVPMGSGAMAAIVGLADETVVMLCQQATTSQELVTPANFNSIGQVVVAGHRPAVERVITLAKEQQAKLALLIPVSVPSHCPLMQPAAEQLATLLNSITLQVPTIPILNNVDGICYQNTTVIRESLIKQLVAPVQWVKIIQTMINAGVTQLFECGPGKVLTGLNKRIDKNLTLMTLTDIDAFLAVSSNPVSGERT